MDANLWTSLFLLQQAGFTPEHLVSVLANGGGSKNLEALQALLQVFPGVTGQEFLVEMDGVPQTSLSLLQQAGFTPEQLVRVLANNGGSKNLEALQALLQVLPDETGQEFLVGMDGIPQTSLSLLQKAGFTPEHLVRVLANHGGSKNLAALQALLQILLDETGQEFLVEIDGIPQTSLSLLQKAGFTPEQLVRVLANIGGSKNLAALQALLQVFPGVSGQEFLVGMDGIPQTSLSLLQESGFTPEQLVSVLAHGGGSKTIIE